MPSPFEQFAINRVVQRAGVQLTPAIEKALVTLLQSAREGNLSCDIDEELPEEICAYATESPEKPFVKFGKKLYLQKHWALETRIIQKLVDLWTRPLRDYDATRFTAALEAEKKHLTEAQLTAVTTGFAKNVTIFTGGPGTGKTYTAAAFIRVIAASQGSCKVIIAAPTGKAAAHLESVFSKQAAQNVTWESMTLHRLLSLRPNTQRLLSHHTIDADLVVVDEASMMDGYLLLHLLQALKPHTRLLLLGDANQLPPVDGVSFFPEIASLWGQKLTRSIRMGEGMVGVVADAILGGSLVDIPRTAWIGEEDRLVDWLCKRLPTPHREEKPDPLILLEELSRFRVLNALRQGPFGIDALNRQILAKFQKQMGFGWFVIPILILQNNPTLGLFNGTSGILVRHDGGGTAYFLEEGGVRAVPEKALPRYEVAFCLSIHKSQGSEFDEVLLLFGPGSERFGVKALYTAVTRAKKKVEICADETALEAAIQNKKNTTSGFVERIKGHLLESK